MKQGKGESQALKRSKTGLHLLVLKRRWSPSAKARGPFEVSALLNSNRQLREPAGKETRQMERTEDKQLNPKISDEPFRRSRLITQFLKLAHQSSVLPEQTSVLMTEIQGSLFFLG